VHVDRHPLALGEQVGNADWRDGGRRRHPKIFPQPLMIPNSLSVSVSQLRLLRLTRCVSAIRSRRRPFSSPPGVILRQTSP
jgi:hypothetical protein